MYEGQKALRKEIYSPSVMSSRKLTEALWQATCNLEVILKGWTFSDVHACYPASYLASAYMELVAS